MRQTDTNKDFQVKEETKLRKKLASLNRENVQSYFNGINDILNELDEVKNDLEADEQLRFECLSNARQTCIEVKQELDELRKRVLVETEEHKSNKDKISKKIEKKSPELMHKIKELSNAEERLKQLEFVKQLDTDYKFIQASVEKQDYSTVLKTYKKLLVDDAKIPIACMDGYQETLESADEFLIASLQEQLNELFTKMRFPFEDPVDHRIMKKQLDTSVEILNALREVYKRTGQDDYEVIQFVIDPFEKRFQFHFCGNKPTNDPAKPEWFFSQILTWIDNNSEYFEEYIQRLFDEWDLNEQADVYFAECLVKQVSIKVRSLLQKHSFVSNKQHFSHLLDETINFSNSIHEMFGTNTDVPEVISLFLEPEILDEWIGLEECAISVAIDGILTDKDAFQNRFDIVNDIDALMVPNFADTFVILMQSMSERYLSFNDSSLRYRFLTHQLVIVDEFLQRIAQIFHEIECPWDDRYPQLMNALWFIGIVLDEWSSQEEFIQLNAVGTDQPLSRGTFDEMSDLYRHEWRKRARNLIVYFRDTINYKIRSYANEKWFQMNHPKPLDFTVSLGPFGDLAVQKIKWAWEKISEDSRLTIYRMLNEEIWACVLENVVTATSFSSRGAAQMLFDIQTGLLPLLQSAFVPSPHLLKADSAFKHFEVVKSAKCKEVINRLKVLALPSPTAILLKSEIERLPETMIAEKLEPLKIDDIGRDKILHIFEQRCDLFENETDYCSNEPAVKGINNDALIKSRQFIRELQPSIVIPGHGEAFRLRSTNSLMQEQQYDQVNLKLLLPATSLYDSVWLLEANEHTFLINTRRDVELSSFIKDDKQLSAVIILNPSARSASAIGQFEAEKLYMGEDVLHSPNIYTSLDSSEWLVDGLVRVSERVGSNDIKSRNFRCDNKKRFARNRRINASNT
ncbi:hypothetical protein M3Y97_00196500 [Aphelenchoides bicaudatus]|nr:hypothetical protein M3Y97_00196500 [Aphelenchoides bicaudatus]